MGAILLTTVHISDSIESYVINFKYLVIYIGATDSPCLQETQMVVTVILSMAITSAEVPMAVGTIFSSRSLHTVGTRKERGKRC